MAPETRDQSRPCAGRFKTLLASVTTLFGLTDEQAMVQVREENDPHAFALLVRRWETPIQRLCTRMLGDEHRGEDLAQDAFARLFARRREYQPTGRFSTFLWRIALNLCYDELRRQKRHPEAPLEDDEGDRQSLPGLAAPAPPPDDTLLRREESELVRAAVLQLSETYRGVVILRHYEDLKFREIAEVLGIPEGTVKSRMAEALSQLHRCLARTFQERSSVLCKTNPKFNQESLVL